MTLYYLFVRQLCDFVDSVFYLKVDFMTYYGLWSVIRVHDQLETVFQCVQPSVVLPSPKERFDLSSGAFALREGVCSHGCLPRISHGALMSWLTSTFHVAAK